MSHVQQRQTRDPVEIVVLCGAAFAALAPLILAIELIEWLLTGQWPGWSVEDGLLFIGMEEPLARFSVVQFALDIATDLPLAIGVYLAGLVVFYAGMHLEPDE